jgi:hypothetical protein
MEKTLCSTKVNESTLLFKKMIGKSGLNNAQSLPQTIAICLNPFGVSYINSILV